MNGGSLESGFISHGEIPGSSVSQLELARMFPEGLESGLVDSTLTMPKKMSPFLKSIQLLRVSRLLELKPMKLYRKERSLRRNR